MTGPHPDPLEAHILDGKLEPEVRESSDERAPLYSIAISLKRIADALHGDDQNTGMKHALAEMATRAFNGWGPSS